MKVFSQIFSFAAPFLSLFSILVPSSATAEPPLEAWVVAQPWYEALADPMPPGVSLRFTVDSSDDPDWDVVEFREVHRPGSGFDPDVSPRVATLRVSQDRKRTAWLNDLTGEWVDLARFYESRKTSPAAPLSTTINSAPENELSADLDGDGALETVRWVLLDSAKSNQFFQLFVIDARGKTLWTGPTSKTTDNAYIFFQSHIGISLPQLLHDVTGDGLVELLGPEPQSDVSATVFRRMSWKDGAFLVLDSRPLMMETPGGNRFAWVEGDHSFGIWVSRFGQVTGEGLVAAEITRYTEDGIYESGTVLLRFDREGAQIERWTTPLGASSSSGAEEEAAQDSPAMSSSAPIKGAFAARFSIELNYSPAARKKLVDSGETLSLNLIVDQYGLEFMEEEAIAMVDLTVDPAAPAALIAVNGIPFSDPAYQVNPEKRYRLTVTMSSARSVFPENVVDAYSESGEVDWDALQLNGKTLSYLCRLIGEEDEASDREMGPGEKTSVYDPFADVTPGSLLD